MEQWLAIQQQQKKKFHLILIALKGICQIYLMLNIKFYLLLN